MPEPVGSPAALQKQGK